MTGLETSVNAVHDTTSIISQVGPTITIIAVFILIFLAVQAYMVAQNREYQKTQNDLLQTLVELVVKQSTQAQQEHERNEEVFDEKNLMDLYMKLNTKLKEDCRDAMEILEADRTSIYAFHNGSQSTHGLPFFKFSCICEYIAKGSGSRSKMKIHNSIPLNLLDDVMNRLWAEGHYEYYPNSDDATDDNNFISKLLLQDKNKTCIFYTIYDMENKIIGFILSEFSKDHFTPEELKEKKKFLKLLAEKISPILEFSNYHKNMKKDAGAY